MRGQAIPRAHTLVIALLLLALARPALAQFSVPEDMLPFWERYSAAHAVDDEDEMDKLVKRYEDDSKAVLDIMLYDLSTKDVFTMHAEARSLAWSLDRAFRTERYIERVRLVLGLEMGDRVRRRRARDRFYDAVDLATKATKDRSAELWDEASAAYRELITEFEAIGDTESSIDCLGNLADIEADRKRKWERAGYLQQIIQKAETLSYRDELAERCKLELSNLVAEGFDPDKPKPEGLEEQVEVEETGGGRTLTSFKLGSEEHTATLERVVPKKGLVGFELPSFHPPDQFQLWPLTYVGGDGPDEFDSQRPVALKPHGVRWSMGRSGIAKFTIDVDVDGRADLEFSPSTTPALIEVPHPDGGEPYPLMVSILSDRELTFSVETNYAPNQQGARMRFGLAQYLEAKVEGQELKFFDLNMDGELGAAIENWDDLVTNYDEDAHVVWHEPDGVIVGRGKTAVPLSSVMQIGKGWYRVDIDSAKGEVSTRELDLATGFVSLDADLKIAPSHLIVREISGKLEGAYFEILPPRRGKPAELPVGTYQICFGLITTGKKTSRDLVRIYEGRSKPFEVESDETVELEIGAPFDASFLTRQDGDERMLDTRTIRVFGRGGEEYARFFDEPLQLEVDVRGSDGHIKEKGAKTRRAGIAEWQEDSEAHRVLWFPVRFSVPNPRNEALEFRIFQKAHPLLGGPIQSDWIR